MQRRTKPLDDAVINLLRRCRVDGARLFLPDEQLPRPLYEKVDAALKLLGGKWNRKERAHLFPNEVGDIIADALESGALLDRRTSLQFFETPPGIARRLIDLARPRPGEVVLEPSAGHGAIIKHLPADASVVAVEIDPANADAVQRVLDARGGAHALHRADFLRFAAAGPALVDVVVMNPPFSGGQDIDHLIAAHGLLKPGGRLAAIVSEGPFFRTDRRCSEFRRWLEERDACVEPLEPGAFAESGTGVATRIVYVEAA